MVTLENYRDIVGDKVVSQIYRMARKLYDKHLIHLNSTYQGGGVAEILASLVPLMNDSGIDAGWRILHGNPDFFSITKKFHNALQGGSIHFTERKKELYEKTNEKFSVYTHIHHDCVIVHDPQPLPIIQYYKKRQPWIWRCHIDLSDPHKELWEFLKRCILRYDMVVVSSEKYLKKDLPVIQRIIPPAIDPLSLKNRDLPEATISKYIKKAGILNDKPIISQISRMDPWKDPEGVLDVFMNVKEKVDCRLIYGFNTAADDPEGVEIYERVYKKAKKYLKNQDVMFVLGDHDILVNALQRYSTVVVQKSIREGFCLAVTEALWKGKPVVGTNVGGIPVQIKDGENGFLVEPDDTEGMADRIIQILKKPKLGKKLGENARETVREKFLLSRLLIDYLDLINNIME